MERDAVPFTIYAHDMDELGATASSALKVLRGENEELHRLVWALVYSAGGKIKVDPHLLIDAKLKARGCVLNTWRDVVDGTIAFKAVRTMDKT